MRMSRALIAAGMTGLMLAASVSGAEARWFHRGGFHRGPGLVGGIVVGAATLATLPFAVVGAAINPGPAYGPPPGYGYGPPQGYGPAYGPPQSYGPPQGYGPPPGYYNGY
jgi:hypothetical protein